MNKYEAMFIVKADLSEDDKKALQSQITETVVKLNGSGVQIAVWAERRKLAFTIKRQVEGTYWLMHFMIPPSAIAKLKELFRLNEQILRALITSAP
jgi:ribosomal protein S6